MAKAILVAGLGFGDEGKGTVVDYLCASRNAELVVRYNGGSQAAHNVVLPNGRHHTFSQVGSGYFQGAATFLSKHMLVDLGALSAETRALLLSNKSHAYPNGPVSVHVDPECTLILPYHRAANRIRETMRSVKHGTCGTGVGEARSDELAGVALKMKDLKNRTRAISLMEVIRSRKISELDALGDWRAKAVPVDVRLMGLSAEFVCKDLEILYFTVKCLSFSEVLHQLKPKTVVFEGAQGVLLDENFGFYPYNTWTDTTFNNALSLLSEVDFSGLVEKCGVIRTYMTRHGEGPFPTFSVNHRPTLFEGKKEHNTENPWQGEFRSGPLDVLLLQYAVAACRGVDYLAMTHCDIPHSHMAVSYDNGEQFRGMLLSAAGYKPMPSLENMEKLSKEMFSYRPTMTAFDETVLEKLLRTQIRIRSFGPTCRDKKE